MNTNNFTGIQHIGIPTNDFDKTVDFYSTLGFEVAFQTVNGTSKVAFLRLNDLVIETSENNNINTEAGAINHLAIDVNDIEEAYKFICDNNLNNTNDTIHFLPFWDNGVKFFTIQGPSGEKVEFSQML
nr:VOC family protein [uncultured Ruminococcus sp.]